MPRRAKSICRNPRCQKLLDQPGYCDKHKVDAVPFFKQNREKTEETIKFYRSYRWTQTSKMHRKRQPLCQDCQRKGKVKQGTLVHHEPELTVLLARGLDPCDEKYLETSCFNCHQKHLQSKR